MRTFLAAALLALFAAGCGRSLDEPEDLTIRDYAAGQVTLSFVMTTCSNTCYSYDEGSCSVDVDRDKMTIDVDVSVGFGGRDGANSSTLEGCSNRCGPAVLAHCDPVELSAGTYTVKAGDFEQTIFVE